MQTEGATLADRLVNADEDCWIPTVPPPARGDDEALAILGRLDCASHSRAATRAIAGHLKLCEGASFRKVAPDVDLIVVRGAQPLHHDRHMAGTMIEGRPAEHTWNYVLESDGCQLLLVEVAQDAFEHLALDEGAFVYFNTINRHLVSRSDPLAHVVIAQVCGFGPGEGRAAAERLKEVLGSL